MPFVCVSSVAQAPAESIESSWPFPPRIQVPIVPSRQSGPVSCFEMGQPNVRLSSGSRTVGASCPCPSSIPQPVAMGQLPIAPLHPDWVAPCEINSGNGSVAAMCPCHHFPSTADCNRPGVYCTVAIRRGCSHCQSATIESPVSMALIPSWHRNGPSCRPSWSQAFNPKNGAAMAHRRVLWSSVVPDC